MVGRNVYIYIYIYEHIHSERGFTGRIPLWMLQVFKTSTPAELYLTRLLFLFVLLLLLIAFFFSLLLLLLPLGLHTTSYSE